MERGSCLPGLLSPSKSGCGFHMLCFTAATVDGRKEWERQEEAGDGEIRQGGDVQVDRRCDNQVPDASGWTALSCTSLV